VNAEQKNIQNNYAKSQDNEQSSSDSSGWLPLRLTIILIFLVWWALTMIGIIVFFSIKARLNSSSDNWEDEW
jgi:flagellar basal body-associated protein FliL